MGIDLMKNFNKPFHARNIMEFWQRWHISLSTWFRDYVYIPLGGSKQGEGRMVWALLVTFLLSGLWHGAGLHYKAWGLWNGAFVAAEVLLARTILNPMKLPSWVRNLYTLVVVCAGWIFFRAENLPDALHLLRSARLDVWATATDATLIRMHETTTFWLQTAAAVAIWLVVEVAQERGPLRKRLALQPNLERILGAGLLVVLFLLGSYEYASTFIYFQF
jgi:D-alanyl-lipoteichoic acid acyltransferase DltB (MBOAT superfamily)